MTWVGRETGRDGSPPSGGGLAIPYHPIRALVSPYTWLAITHLLSDFWFGLLSFTSVVTLLTLSVSLLPAALLGVPVFVLTAYWSRGLATLERARFHLTLDVAIDSPPPPDRTAPPLRQVGRLVISPSTWRQIGYHLLMLPLGAFTMTVTLACSALPVALVLLPAYNGALPNGGANLGVFRVHGALAEWVIALVGLGLLLGAPSVVRGLAIMDIAVARALLGRYSSRELAERVGELERSRRRVLDAAEAERRRIERDLHDGAQQRLVALAMTLGRAKARYGREPDSIGTLLDEAHSEAKQAVAELRDLTRGIHPPVLADRGLDAALSALAARSPVPVSVTVDAPVRPSQTVEAIAYFVVAEALTNVAKHAGAHQASVLVQRVGDTLRVTVLDDGRGGADASAGTGLRGLADRVTGVDGRLAVDSPPGGPTTLTVELPCG
ncbi:MAG: sensor domain-containing protein [Actinobacteria bacterium]|nr:sensor domain-containing protein [Actinomycetota bacterium]MBI3688077.1 sensor domain-containing protein [Actinomycetota bacterium]